MSDLPAWLIDSIYILIAILLVVLNGFFVAAEFALVKVRSSQLDALVQQGRPIAKTAQWLAERLDSSLSVCQLGITMASLALGWVGEPAFGSLLEPVFRAVGVESDTVIHTTAFIVAFTVITTLHLVIGEQAPKIFAIRRPELMVLWCAVPLRFFYVIAFPMMIALNASTAYLLRLVGIDGASEHETPHTEDEIRALIHQSHTHGELTRSEHRLLHAVFEFDDMICRRVMVPRSDTEFFDATQPVSECLALARRNKHTRYPLCEGSLDKIIGIVHIKDLIGTADPESIDLRSIARPAQQVPETMPISRLLRHFQSTHQLMAIVVDEHATVVGIVTLENVLEPIVGAVEDEFDSEPEEVVAEEQGTYLVLGSASIRLVNRRLKLNLNADDVDTFSGLLMERTADLPEVGDQIDLDGATAEVLEVDGARATRIRVTLAGDNP